MTKRMDQLNVSLGANAAERRAALERLATAVRAYGRNGVPSISEMLGRIADAAGHDPQRATYLMNEIMILAAEGYVLAAEEMQDEAVSVRGDVRE